MGLQYQQQLSLGDTTLTKVFVGGLAWETQKEVLREHFDQYGEILEAVIISDKITSRSKGYGFVTFKDPEAAKKACEEATPVINGRRANCNLASLGARRRPSPPATPPPVLSHQPALTVNVPRGIASGPPAPWYYHPAGPPPPPSPYHQRHHYPGVVPVYPTAGAGGYGYSPSYMTEMPYSTPAKLSPHPQAQFAYPSQGGMVSPNAMMPVYPMYHYHHQPQNMSVHAAHFYPQSTMASPGTVTAMPIISKPVSIAPATVEQVTSCN